MTTRSKMNLATVISGPYKGYTINIDNFECDGRCYCDLGGDKGHIYEPKSNLTRWVSVEGVKNSQTEMQRITNKDLLPCPFCGGEAEFERVGTRKQSCIIACTNCGCTLESNETWNSGQAWNNQNASTQK